MFQRKLTIDKRYGLLLLSALVLLTATEANAGAKVSAQVSITSSSAAGAVGSARSSADSNQTIGCIYGTSIGGFCFATNAAGTTKSCIWSTAQNSVYLPLVYGIGSTSHISFGFDANGSCTYLQVSHSSTYQPMVP